MKSEVAVRFYINDRIRMFDEDFSTIMDLHIVTAAQDIADMIKDDLEMNYKHYIGMDQMTLENSVRYDFRVITMNEKEYRGLVAAKEELRELKELLKGKKNEI